ncbi:trypsin-like peptidase domain-containing protein [Streptomyces sp. NPDC048291]|uniref:trypsin-like peptidase domain-containing protein n=1 Tax=Streptomyces sp. NPDC048291 TaxID=3365530 RepID=UPI0037116574
MDGWRGLLAAATVALDLPGTDAGGTGFVIAPGVVVTCAHVVAGADEVRGRIGSGSGFALTVTDAERYRSANGLDVAFLRFAAEASYVLASPVAALGDRLRAYGHPKGDFRAGQWATLEYQGDSRLGFEDAMAMPRGYGVPVGEGFSGSPVVNERTGAVCGMLARSNKAGSAHMIPVAEILARCAVPAPPVAWLQTLTDEQVRAGGHRYPGALLRDYLEAAREAADEHPYAALLTDAGDVPLSTVYVRQEASHTEDRAVDDGPRGRRRSARAGTAAESVLTDHRHVHFTGGAGSGKSSLLRRLAFTAASAWLDDPGRAPSYIPVLVTADQLVDRPLPEALANALARDLPGLRRSPVPELYESAPMPSVDWLVCVDGLDEVLDPEHRSRVIRLIQRWAREPHLRFVVASRSLVTAEMNRLDELERYVLREFDDAEVGELVRTWFRELCVEDARTRADTLTDTLRQGRLAEVARNPLYLTMICAVAAVRDLPRNPAELYARFVGVLREKGAQRLRRSEPGAHGITPDLLEQVYDVLHPVAELRQRGDIRPLLDQAVELLVEHAPPETVLRALTFTGLTRQRGGALYFLHHTIQEYLAGHAIADRLNPKDPEALRTVREAIAAERPNLVLFMAARWHEQGMPMGEFMRTVVDDGGWRDLLLCATILSDELVTDEELTARFARAVLKLYDSDVHVGDIYPDSVLDRLYAVLDPPGLADIVGDPHVPHQARVEALRHLVARNAEGAVALATVLADDPGLSTDIRVDAVGLLARAGDRRGASGRLRALAADPGHVPATRLKAALALVPLDPAAGTDSLASLLRAVDFPQTFVTDSLRLLSAGRSEESLSVLADALADNPALAGRPHTLRVLRGLLLAHVAPEALRTLCLDPEVPLHLRHWVTWHLDDVETIRLVSTQVVQDPHSPEDAVDDAVGNVDDVTLVESTARNERLSAHRRLRAVAQLVRLDQPSLALDCLESLLAVPGHVDRCAQLLRELGEPVRARHLLAESFNDPQLPVGDRVRHVSSLIALGASELLRVPLTDMAVDVGTGAADRLQAAEEIEDLDPAGAKALVHGIAADDSIPGDDRLDAATRLLNSGERDIASSLLRRISADRRVGMRYRVRALEKLAEVDLRATSETLHRVLDEAGLPDEHLWQLLSLADAMTPEVTLRRRLYTLIEDESVPTDSFLDFDANWEFDDAVGASLVRRALSRVAEDPAAGPWARTRAGQRLLGLVPYPRWKALMAEVAEDRMYCLNLHLDLAGYGTYPYSPEVSQTQSFVREEEGVTAPAGAFAGVDPREAAEYWIESLAQRRPEAVTRLGNLWLLVHVEAESDRIRERLLSWARDTEAPLPERIAASRVAAGHPHDDWHAVASDASVPPELRVAICEHLPVSGAFNRIPLTRALTAEAAHPVGVRAQAAALLAEDLGEEGRQALLALSGPATTAPEAHLAAAAAWVKLDIGCEAEAACLRVLDDARATAHHRVRAAGELLRWRSARDAAKRTLRSVLSAPDAPVPVRIDAAERLLTARATADAHLGLLRLALEHTPTSGERSRITALLPADLRAHLDGVTRSDS